MNLNFLLSSEKDGNCNNGSNGSNRAPRPDNHRGRSSDPAAMEVFTPHPDPQGADHTRYSAPRHGQTGTAPRPKTAREQAAQAAQGTLKGKPPRTEFPSTRPRSEAVTRPHVCPSCERSFYKLEQLKRHDRLVHLNLRPFICASCDLSFGTKQNMQVHLTTKKHSHRLEALEILRKHNASNSSKKKH